MINNVSGKTNTPYNDKDKQSPDWNGRINTACTVAGTTCAVVDTASRAKDAVCTAEKICKGICAATKMVV